MQIPLSDGLAVCLGLGRPQSPGLRLTGMSHRKFWRVGPWPGLLGPVAPHWTSKPGSAAQGHMACLPATLTGRRPECILAPRAGLWGHTDLGFRVSASPCTSRGDRWCVDLGNVVSRMFTSVAGTSACPHSMCSYSLSTSFFLNTRNLYYCGHLCAQLKKKKKKERTVPRLSCQCNSQ